MNGLSAEMIRWRPFPDHYFPFRRALSPLLDNSLTFVVYYVARSPHAPSLSWGSST